MPGPQIVADEFQGLVAQQSGTALDLIDFWSHVHQLDQAGRDQAQQIIMDRYGVKIDLVSGQGSLVA